MSDVINSVFFGFYVISLDNTSSHIAASSSVSTPLPLTTHGHSHGAFITDTSPVCLAKIFISVGASSSTHLHLHPRRAVISWRQSIPFTTSIALRNYQNKANISSARRHCSSPWERHVTAMSRQSVAREANRYWHGSRIPESIDFRRRMLSTWRSMGCWGLGWSTNIGPIGDGPAGDIKGRPGHRKAPV